MAKFFRWGGGSHGNKKLLYAGGLLLVLFLTFSGVAATDSSNPDSCARCHVMQPLNQGTVVLLGGPGSSLALPGFVFQVKRISGRQETVCETLYWHH